MAVKTCLDVVKEVCYRINQPAPSALGSTTDPNNLQWRELLFEVGEYVRDNFEYPALKRKYTFATVSGQKFYPLPGDFWRLLLDTQWDDTNSWALFGPATDGDIATLDKGVIGNTQLSFRVAGAPFDALGEDSFDVGGGYIEVAPTPSDVRTLSIEYIGANWFQPVQWVASTSYTSGDFFSANRNIYKCTANGTSNSVRPTGESGLIATYGIDYQLWRGLYNVLDAGDGDYPLIDPHTLKLGLRAAWLRSKGLDDSQFQEPFRRAALTSQGRFQGVQGVNADCDQPEGNVLIPDNYLATGF